jgi:hypothetical protein
MPERVRIVIRSDDPSRLREVISGENLDINCGGAMKNAAGEWSVEAFVPQAVATRLSKLEGIHVEVDKGFERRALARRTDVGTGDRFKGGRVAPRGVGDKKPG